MNLPSHRYFCLPPNLKTPSEQINFCLDLIQKYRSELPVLRESITIFKRQQQKAESDVAFWKQKYEQEKESHRQAYHIFKEEKGNLEKEIEKLKSQIEQLTKTKHWTAPLPLHTNERDLITFVC